MLSWLGTVGPGDVRWQVQLRLELVVGIPHVAKYLHELSLTTANHQVIYHGLWILTNIMISSWKGITVDSSYLEFVSAIAIQCCWQSTYLHGSMQSLIE